jgi:TnpA family transposase
VRRYPSDTADITSNRRDEQEMSVLFLHIVQAAMV